MAGRQVKGGYLLRHKRRLLGPNVWREQWVVLLEDSTLAWYKDNGSIYPEGVLRVRDCPELLAVSLWTLRIPGRPRLPQGCGVLQLLAIGQGKATQGQDGQADHPRKLRKVHWMLSRSQQECHEWMTAISLTLPPLPPPRTPSFKSSSGRGRNANDSCPDSADGVVDLPSGLLTGSGVHNWQSSQAQTQAQAQAQLLQWGGWGQGGGYVTSDPCGHHGHMHTGSTAQTAYSWQDHQASLATAAHHDCSGMEAMHTDMDIGDLGDLGVGMDCLGDFSF